MRAVCLQRLRVTWTRPAKITNLAETAVVVRNLFSLLDNKPGEPASLRPCSRDRSCPDSVLLFRKRCKSWSRRAYYPNRILVLHTGPGAASTGARDGNIRCLICVRAAFGCAAELWRNLLPSTIAIRTRFAARCGHRLYKTMFGFPSGACYVCGELGVAKCRASRSSEHSCKEKCSRSLCFCCSFSFACLCALGS